ncbi:16584_t:CDS:2, partial [Gigaspora rosea]
MATRSSKKLANDKISTTAKRGSKKMEINLLSVDNSQDNSNTAKKRGRKKKQEKTASSSRQVMNEFTNDNNNLQGKYYIDFGNNEDVQGHNKKQKIITPLSSQVIYELLKDSDDLQDDDEIASLVLGPSIQFSPTLEPRVVLLRRSLPAQGSRTNANIRNDFYQHRISPLVSPLKNLATIKSNSSNNMLGHFNPNNTVIPSPLND